MYLEQKFKHLIVQVTNPWLPVISSEYKNGNGLLLCAKITRIEMKMVKSSVIEKGIKMAAVGSRREKRLVEVEEANLRVVEASIHIPKGDAGKI